MTISIGGMNPQPKTEFNENDGARVTSSTVHQNIQGTEAAQVDEPTTLLSGATSIAAFTKIAMNGDDTRAGKVDQLRQEVSAGAYKLEPGNIADALLQNWR